MNSFNALFFCLLALLAWTPLARAQPTSTPGPSADDSLYFLDTVSIKTVRVTFHVFQDVDGGRQIPDNGTTRYWLGLLLQHADKKMRKLDTMHLPTSSPYFADSKIRFHLSNIYFWQRTALWAMGDKNKPQQARAQYDFIMAQPDVAHKTSSVHVFIPGNAGPPPYTTGGAAAGLGDPRYAMIENVYHWHQQNGNYWGPGSALRHEFGHNFGLRHDWGNDGLDDTPPNCRSCCWSGPDCSNNLMGYNSTQAAMTLQQAQVYHRHLARHPELLVQTGKE